MTLIIDDVFIDLLKKYIEKNSALDFELINYRFEDSILKKKAAKFVNFVKF